MKKQILNSVLSLISILLIGCGSDSKPNAADITPGTTALSIVYDSTSDSSSGKMIGHYHVHAVDDSGKPMSGLKLKLSLINGVKQIQNEKVQKGTGNILTTTPITFDDNGVDFSRAGISVGDSLIVLPTAGKTGLTYLGDWRISGIGQKLTLEENSFHLESTENLTYIIGNEERLLGGKNGNRGVLTVAHIQKKDDNATFVTDKNGFTYFDVVFDPVLSGHTVTVGVHTSGNRLGISKVIGLRGAEFPEVEVSIENTGHRVVVPMTLSIQPTNGGSEHLIDLDINPSSFTVEPTSDCQIDYRESDFHTDSGGRVFLVVNTNGLIESTEGNTTTVTGAETCTIKWEGSVSSIYLEY